MSAATQRPLRIALVAGEASGDALGAGLIAALRARLGEVRCAGIGGPQMRAAGFDGWHDCGELAVMGLAEVLRHLPRLLRLRRQLRRQLDGWQPDLFIGIDAPDFNLPIERALKTQGVPTVHYVSPSVWAWREQRARRIGASADRVLCLFPMEPPIYRRYGVDARFVGHPLADAFPLYPDHAAAKARLQVDPALPTLALLPGSRVGEIERLLPVFLQACALLRDALPALQVLMPSANAQCAAAIARVRAQLPRADFDLRVLEGQAHDAMLAADAVLLASGTAALEALLAKRPMLVAYRISAMTYALVMGLGLMKVRQYSLPNALAGHLLVPELMQRDCAAAPIAAGLLPWLLCPQAGDVLQPQYRAIHQQLGSRGSQAAADAVLELLGAAR